MLEGEGRIGFRYCGPKGEIDNANNLNGSCNNIAGLYNGQGNILGMMPHPENAIENMLGGTDGKLMFDSIYTGLRRLLG
jgi:phosphoribosylformylglycinamidine synthase